MPRDLSQLMENAVSTPPHEPHLAGDITRLAQRHQRRRTTFVAAGAALVVVAVAGVTVGLSGHQPSTPEPAARYSFGLASTLPAICIASFLIIGSWLRSAMTCRHL